jgi:hypothetical protein
MIKTILPILLLIVSTYDPMITEINGAVINDIKKKETHMNVPVLHINSEEFTPLESLFFKNAVGGKDIEQETLVSLKFSVEFLEIKFECRDNPRMDQNYYTENNTPLFHQEVFEIFIHEGAESSENYLELQINPNNAIFLARISNRYKTDHTFELELLDAELPNIEHAVFKDPEHQLWKGYLKIPLQLIGNRVEDPGNVYRMNIYRIISEEDHEDPQWTCDAKNATFACWSSTMTEEPQFHVPERFGYLYFNKPD